MKEGIWRLRCQHCGGTFSVELTAENDITEVVSSEVCPNCNMRPDGGRPDAGPAAWHQVMDFKAPGKLSGANDAGASAPRGHESFRLQASGKQRSQA
jgi:hypothetical protein